MALPDFKNPEQNIAAVPEWAKYLSDGQFISYSNTCTGKIYFHLFDKYIPLTKNTTAANAGASAAVGVVEFLPESDQPMRLISSS